MRDQSAQTQVLRVITTVLGAATVVFLVLTWVPLNQSSDSLRPWWQISSAAIVFGGPLLVAVLARFTSRGTLTWLLSGYSVAFTVVVMTFVPAMTAPALPAGVAPWPVLITAIGTVPAALVWRPVWAWLFLLVNSVLIAPVRYFAAGGSGLSEALEYAFFTITFAGIFTGITIVVMRNGAALDAATAHARAAAATAAAVLAREREQTRLDALVHDEVISTLYAAVEGRPEHAGSVRRQAAAALDHLARLRAPSTEAEGSVPVEEFIGRITSVVGELCPTIAIETRGLRSSPVPALVADTFVEAAAEAVRNSLDHASGGDKVTRTTSLFLGEGRIRATVVDDGIGFDPDAIPPHRLGIAVSIVGRLEALDGGSALVTSRPGAGTRIQLDWQPS